MAPFGLVIFDLDSSLNGPLGIEVKLALWGLLTSKAGKPLPIL